MSAARPTIRDVARQAGVSTATVSNVMNKTGTFSPETERKVQFAIEALNYTPNVHARQLAFRRRLSVEREFA